MMPSYQTTDSAGADLVSLVEVSIPPGQIAVVPTGAHLPEDFPRDCFAILVGRSSLTMRRNLQLANGIGIIDPDYRDEIRAMLHNIGTTTQTIQAGERIAQLVVVPFVRLPGWMTLDAKRSGGFGSTGRGVA